MGDEFLDFAFGFGAFVTPMLLALILRRLENTKGLLLLAMLATTPVVLGAFAEMPPPPVAPQVWPRLLRSGKRRRQVDRGTPLEPGLLGTWIRLPVLRATGDVHGRLGHHARPSTDSIGCSDARRSNLPR